MAAEIVSWERLREVLDYDPETGIFVWKVNQGKNRTAGKKAGFAFGPYWSLRVDKVQYLAHRLAWYYAHGYMPDCGIDHKDNDKRNNALFNLREGNQSLNMQNLQKCRSDNKTGYLGVCWHSRDKKYQAQIHLDGKNHFLGLYDTAEEAHQAYIEAKRKLHPFGEL